MQKQTSKRRFDPKRLNRGIVLVQNLPKGFYEPQLRKYFAQYGRVTRLRLARSLRTGQSKHYAYVEFQYPEVAKIAADTMNNYMMFRQILKTAFISPDKQDHDYFKQPVKRVKIDGVTKFITPSMARVNAMRRQMNKPLSEESIANSTGRVKRK